MAAEDPREASRKVRERWDLSAAFWDEKMGEGNEFVEVLIWPPTERMLALRSGERVLDIACGNGLSSRRLATMGAEVVAFDLSEEMIAHARRRTSENAERITYLVLDGTDEDALLALGERSFEAAICNMALFDMADIKPLMRALARLLRPEGRFVFSVLHPCFNGPSIRQVAKQEDREGELVTRYSVEVSGYLTPTVSRAVAIPGEPVPNLLFHRPLQDLLGAGFDAGFLLNGLEERAFPPGSQAGRHPLSWGPNFSEIPPVLVGRMQLRE
jgi:2-polyprenyl-3-methyl-5-hydroxy-6-metoxy-1,4-benzoquinol methylase